MIDTIAGLFVTLTDVLPSAAKRRRMTTIVSTIKRAVFPPVPEMIRDDFMRLTAGRLQSQSRLLFLALLLTVPTAIRAASGGAPAWVRLGLPVVMGAACFAGFLSLCRDLKLERSVWRSQRLMSQSTWVSSILAVVCSAWCVTSWLTAPEGMRIYYPMILSMGSLGTAYCLSSLRLATILNLAIGLLPISTLLILSGNRMDLAAGTSLMIAAAFLLRMIVQQHSQLVDLLMLQRQMRELANTDPLTGLLNRRAFNAQLDAELASPDRDNPFALALLDLDGFKPLNDRYGHSVGDRLLCEVADRLRNACGSNGHVARLGGDEFAVLVPHGSAIAFSGIADLLLATLLQPCAIDDHVIRVGASIGVAIWPDDGATGQTLFDTADRALYAVKTMARRDDHYAARPSLSAGLSNP